MTADSIQGLVRRTTKRLLSTAVIRLPRFRYSVPRYPGARIVMYHEVPSGTARQFKEHLSYFANTYEVVSLDRLVKALMNGGSVNNWLAITFDDGFKDNIEIAVPLLQEFGLTACFFVTTQFVSLDPLNQEGYRRFLYEGFQRSDPLSAMDWNDIRSLLGKGFSVGSHSRSHADLAKLPLSQALEEIYGSQTDIENNLKNGPIHFAWPFGKSRHFNGKLSQAAQDAGYLSCCSAMRGVNDKRTSVYNMRRDHLGPDWSIEMVRFFLEGGYDWVRHLSGWDYLSEGGTNLC